MKLVYDAHVSPPVDDEDALDFNVFEANLLVQGDAKTKPLVYRTIGSSKNTVVGEVHHAGLFVGAYLERFCSTLHIDAVAVESMLSSTLEMSNVSFPGFSRRLSHTQVIVDYEAKS